jgi:hypothetical protein
MAAITYTGQEPIHGDKFQCPRCNRVYPFPQEHERPVRCECGWWYTNVGRGKIVEEFHPRIGGADRN